MKKVLIVQHVPREKPGFICCVLDENNITYDIVDLHNGGMVSDFDSYGAMIVLGGPCSANDDCEKIQKSSRIVESWLQENKPYLGVCLGMQLLVKSVGGVISKSPVKELGFRDHIGEPHEISLTEKGQNDPLFKNLDSKLHVFHLHGDQAEQTEGIELLATGKHCKQQVVKVGDHAYGLQCHFELTRDMLELWIEEDNDLNHIDGYELRADYQVYETNHLEKSRQLFSNFLKLAQII